MKEFDNYQEAFAYCREADKPVTVVVNGEKQKLFPSGRAEVAAPAPATPASADCYDCATCPALADQHCLGR